MAPNKNHRNNPLQGKQGMVTDRGELPPEGEGLSKEGTGDDAGRGPVSSSPLPELTASGTVEERDELKSARSPKKADAGSRFPDSQLRQERSGNTRSNSGISRADHSNKWREAPSNIPNTLPSNIPVTEVIPPTPSETRDELELPSSSPYPELDVDEIARSVMAEMRRQQIRRGKTRRSRSSSIESEEIHLAVQRSLVGQQEGDESDEERGRSPGNWEDRNIRLAEEAFHPRPREAAIQRSRELLRREQAKKQRHVEEKEVQRKLAQLDANAGESPQNVEDSQSQSTVSSKGRNAYLRQDSQAMAQHILALEESELADMEVNLALKRSEIEFRKSVVQDFILNDGIEKKPRTTAQSPGAPARQSGRHPEFGHEAPYTLRIARQRSPLESRLAHAGLDVQNNHHEYSLRQSGREWTGYESRAAQARTGVKKR
ncbi:hypothetical protein C8R43DRAFT_956254 [Mycena crocata]|nr:hypothetical protein C8R43DRAFT_956254 [Mycena crocata]